MKSANDGYFDVIKLAKEIRGERLFIQSEIQHIRQLNEKLNRSIEELAQAAWTNTQQRFNVKQLVAQGDLSAQTCCKKVDYISSPLFVDARKVLKYQDALVLTSIIQYLRSCPAVASLWLAAAEMERPSVGGAVARALCGGVHVCDITPLRKVLQYLAQYHLSNLEDPQRVIFEGACSYTRLYCELLDGFKPARMFLAAALREPILPLLQIDHCLIVDTDILNERMKKTSQPNIDNNDLQEQLHEYRNRVITELVTVTERFINALCNIWKCFPPTIAWIVQQTVLALRANSRISESDIFYICTNLVFTNFICRAIINPEIYGITDMDISNLSRLNLVQVSMTIEKLCLMKYREVNGKFRDLFSKFEKDCVYPLIDMLLANTNTSDNLSNDLYSTKFENDYMEEILAQNDVEVEDKRLLKTEPFVDSNIVLFTPNDLKLLVDLFKKISLVITDGVRSSHERLDCDASNASLDKIDNLSENNGMKKSNSGANVANAIDKCSDDLSNSNDNEVACGISYTNHDAGFNSSGVTNEELNNLLKGLDIEQVSKLQKLLKRLPSSTFNRDNSNNQNEPLLFKGKNNNSHSPVKNGPKNKNILSQQSREVLVIKLPSDYSHEQIGMTPESKVLECHYSNIVSCHTLVAGMLEHSVVPNNRSLESLDLPQPVSNISTGVKHVNVTTAEVSNSHTGQEKRTRFSLSHDEGSIGNTSDNLEAVSEAASNHSVTSSLEMETEDQNDNLSDMVSANVSGRGSPNISGRDTPSSQVTEGDIGVSNPQPVRQSHIVTNSAIISKQAKLLKRTRHDIEDKFCKFEIKKLIEGDETISIMSDTWSTDVLASDSETIGESIYEKNFITSNLILDQQNVISGAGQLFLPLVPPPPDVSETASESAWSTDALISESDRITEVDMDDSNIRLENNASQYDKGKKILAPIAIHYNQNQNDLLINVSSMPQISTNMPSSSNISACSSNNSAEKISTNKSENHIGMTNDNQNNIFCKVDTNISNDCLNESNKFCIAEGDSANTSINENGVSPLLQTSNKATSQWLNDPCQKFPVQHFDTFNYDSNNFASCSNTHLPKNNVKEVCKALENITICNGENTFKPLKMKKGDSQNHGGNRNGSSLNEYDRKVNLKKNKNVSDNHRSARNMCEENSFMRIMEQTDQNECAIINLDELESSNNNNYQFDSLLHFDPDKINIENAFSNKNEISANDNSLLLKNYTNELCFNDLSHEKECETLTPVNNIDLSTIEKDSIQNAIFESFPDQSDTSNNSHVSITDNGRDIKYTRGASGNDGSNTLPRQSTLFSGSSKPGTSTGAIPKSISFDSTAEKSHRYSGRRLIDDSSDALSLNFGDLKNNMKKSGGNLLNKFKMFRAKSKGHVASISNYGKNKMNVDCGEILRTINDTGSHDDIPKINPNSSELSDDILAKYRRKASSGSDAAASDSTSNSGSTRGRNQGNVPSSEDPVNSLDGDSAPDRYSDIEFDNLQKEIQHALSHIDIYNVELASGLKGSSALECALRLVSIVDSRANSALEGFITLDSTRKPLILNALMGNSAARLPYLNYLSNCRKSLLSTIGGLESEYTWHINEIQRQSALAAASRTRSSLAARELRLADLQERLRSGLVDERRDALFLALDNLTSEITAEEAWADATEWDLEQALITIERVVMSRVYTQTMFPNGEGDVMRDQLLRNHIAKLGDDSSGLAPRLRGTQWIYAQRILDGLCHCKTPRDKVDCVVKCVNNIMSLLSMTSSGIPGADDLTPVLVHVIIKANPSSLLSTIQFVDNFINPQLEGEQLYCWTQFCAAIEHIKTID